MGLATLLNFPEDSTPHHTVFLIDRAIDPKLEHRVREALAPAPTRIHFLTIPHDEQALAEDLRARGISLENDYVSLHCWATGFESHYKSVRLLTKIKRYDFSRLEFPAEQVLPFRMEYLESLVDQMLLSDFRAQDVKIHEFYSLLALQPEYLVRIRTGSDSVLEVRDRAGWFQLGGSLVEGESRILPSGEVAYTGSKVNGRFTVDGTLLAAPQRASVARLARDLSSMRASLRSSPLTFTIVNGEVSRLEGEGVLFELMRRLLDFPEYRQVVEVGIGFNSACSDFVESWPSPANEAHPGAHIALGGDPDPRQPDREVAVHIDWMAARSSIEINGQPFDCGQGGAR